MEKTQALKIWKKRIAVELRKQTNKDKGTVSIISEAGVPWQDIHEVLKVASALKLKAIIATAPRENRSKE